MLAKGKAPKVATAAARREPVVDIPEGRWGASPALPGPYRLTAGKDRHLIQIAASKEKWEQALSLPGMNAGVSRAKLMNELIQINQATPAQLDADFESAKSYLADQLSNYEITVTADTVKGAKSLAAELNKRAKEIDDLRKEKVAEVSEPVRQFDEGMKELVTMCKQGRKKIADQVQRYEDETKAEARRLLIEYRDAQWEEQGVEDEFRRAEVLDLAKLTSMTAGGKLTKGARDEAFRRVQSDKAAQEKVRTRLLELENASYRAGLSAPLTRDHVHRVIESDDATYANELERILEAELERERVARQRDQERARRQEEEDRKNREARAALDNTEVAEGPQVTVKATNIEPEATPPEPDDPRPAAPGKQAITVTAAFETEVNPQVTDAAIEKEIRRKLEAAGIKTLANVSVTRHQVASAA